MHHPYHGKQILVIDPSESTRSTLKHHLECLGAVVYTVGVVEKIKTVIEGTNHSGMKIDLILVDTRLPETYAFFALKVIQTALNGRNIPILVMSHGFYGRAVKQMKQWGVFGYLRKPLRIESLDAFIQERMAAHARHFSEATKPLQVVPTPNQHDQQKKAS